MSEPETEKPTKPKPGWFDVIDMLGKHPRIAAIVGLVAVVLVWGLYLRQFSGGLSDSQETWGQFGDFVGGTLNSVFGFLSFLILLRSLRLQARELEETRNELKAASKAQEKQAEHFEREAKKKDHMEAIEYLTKSINLKPNNFYVQAQLDEPDDNDRHYKAVLPSHPLYPVKNNEESYLRIKEKWSIPTIERESRKLELLDFHCSRLLEISKTPPPLLIFINEEFERVAIHLVAKNWVQGLLFFGQNKLH